MFDLSQFSADELAGLDDERLAGLAADVQAQLSEDRKESQILYYRPNQPAADRIHRSLAAVIGAGGGNRAGKTDTVLAEIAACATGIFPEMYAAEFAAKFRGPIRARICIESLKTVLHPVLLPKLKWWMWNGIDEPGGARGHWGWIPRMCLKDGAWDKSWSEKLTTLTVLCRDPENHGRVLGESVIQMMSFDQDASDFASGSFHIVQMDEPPPFAIWRENQARVLDVRGRIFLTMTWPDDPSIPVDWIYDEVYEKGQDGPNKAAGVEWIELGSLDNVNNDAQAIEAATQNWDEQTKSVRLRGQPLRFSNRVHPLFTDRAGHWCFTCSRPCVPDGDYCGCERRSADIGGYCHVADFEVQPHWPTVYLLDPHPRKPHDMLWVTVDPNDDMLVVEEAEIAEDPAGTKAYCGEIETALGLGVALRLMDPNMGRSPADSRRERSWQDEFADAGLYCDLADDSDVGRGRVNEALKPDAMTRRPRLVFHPRCTIAAQHMKRYVWGDFRRSADRDLKQVPKDKYDDMPALLRYLMNWQPSFRMLYGGAPTIRRPGKRKGAY